MRTDRAGHWLEDSILRLAEEAASHRPGSDAMLAKLSEALFVDTLRRYVRNPSPPVSPPSVNTSFGRLWPRHPYDAGACARLVDRHRLPDHGE